MVKSKSFGNSKPAWYLGLILSIALALGCATPSFAGKKLIAAVLTSDTTRYREAHRAFVHTLARKGYDQANTDIIVQTPNPDPISWANAIRKFEALGADIIVTYGAPITLAAMRETREIPIVFVDVYGPVETGISRSMTMTGKNLCGVSSKVPMITLVKTVQRFKPIKSLGVIYNSREAGSQVQLQELKRIGAQQGLAVLAVNLSSPSALESALNSMLPHIDCLYVSESSLGLRLFDKIVSSADAYNVPVISQIPDAAERGALVALEISPVEQGQMAGECAVKVLNGSNPREMQIMTPKKTELIINMRAARALDLHLPFQVLTAATKVLK